MSGYDCLKFSFPIQDAAESYINRIKKLKFGHDWRVLWFWSSNSPLPHSITVRRNTPNGDVVVGGKFNLLRNGEVISERKFLQLMESEIISIKIKLNNTNLSFETFDATSSLLLKGAIQISRFQGNFLSAPPHNLLMGLGYLAQDLTKLIHPQTSCLAADVNLKCGSASIPAHKAILCARSPVFAAMFAHPMRESAENQVDISDISESILQTMVTYMYTGEVLNMAFSSALELFAAADKYQLMGLKDMCCDFLKDNVSAENVLMLLDLGDAVDRDLKCFAMDYIFKCSDFSTIQNTEAWETLERSKPTLAIEILTSLLKSKDEKIKRLKTH